MEQKIELLGNYNRKDLRIELECLVKNFYLSLISLLSDYHDDVLKDLDFQLDRQYCGNITDDSVTIYSNPDLLKVSFILPYLDNKIINFFSKSSFDYVIQSVGEDLLVDIGFYSTVIINDREDWYKLNLNSSLNQAL